MTWEAYLRKCMVDNVNPSHYKGSIECIDALRASMTTEAFRGLLKGSIMQYMWRYENKGGVEDLFKAQWYLNYLIKELESDKQVRRPRKRV